MKCDKRDLLLYAVTDRSWSEGTTLGAQVEEALRGGATFVQLREKKADRGKHSVRRRWRSRQCAGGTACRL